MEISVERSILFPWRIFSEEIVVFHFPKKKNENEFENWKLTHYLTTFNWLIPVLPKITPFSPGSEAYFPGDYFSLQCSIVHGDLPSIYWKFNDRIIEGDNELRISKTGSKSSVLTIESIRDYHAGNYTCFGRNAAGIANHSVALVVNGSKIKKILCLSFVLSFWGCFVFGCCCCFVWK